MVDLVEIQAAYYMVAATGVLVAAAYYVLNMRAQTRTREIQLFMQMFTMLSSKERMLDNLELFKMEWKDYDEFEKKYGSDANPESYANRFSTWYLYGILGKMIKIKLLSPEMVYNLGATNIIWHWTKWKDIVKEIERRYNMQGAFDDLEYVANLMSEMKKERAPLYRVPETFTKYVPDKYESQ